MTFSKLKNLKSATLACMTCFIIGCSPTKEQTPQNAIAIDGLVAFWDFSGENENAFESKYPQAKYKLKPYGEVSIVEDGILAKQSLKLDGNSYLSIPYADTQELNVKSGQVSVLAWVKKETKSGVGFVAGMWNEYSNGGKRQYGLFVSLPYYNGADQVCGHISKNGGATPPFPFSIDYSASKQKVKDNEWTFVAFTYDGKYIRSYVNGKFEERAPELINHTKGFKGCENGLVHSKNPYFYPDGIGDNGSDFTVGAVQLKRGMGNFFKGNISGICVYNRALSIEELAEINESIKLKK